MFRSFKVWMSIALIVVLVVCIVTDGFGLAVDIDYVTAVVSVALSVMIMLGVIDRDLPADTDAESIQDQLSKAKDNLERDGKVESEDK